MFIKITKAHIAAGYAGSCPRCPVALALKEILDEKELLVGNNAICFIWPYVVLELPPIAQEFIAAFDAGNKNLAPFKFWLPLD